MSLDSQTCLVTGASRGIGRGIARDGARVAVNYRSSIAEAETVVGEIESAGGEGVTAQADVADSAAVERMRERVHEELGPVDVLVDVSQQGNYGQANSGSTANCFAPGFVRTAMLDPERVKEKILRDIPLDRFATIEDVSGIVAFVASPESSYTTGQVIGVNGGMVW